MTPEQFMEGATVTDLGEDWGRPRLWRVENEQAGASVDVRAADEDAAREAAREHLPGLLGSPA